MKKTLLKIALIAVFCLSISGHSRAFSSLNIIKSLKIAQGFRASKEARYFSHSLGVKTQQDLKFYHFTLKALFPQYRIPSSQDLLDSIRSHSKFFGLFTQLEALEKFKLGNTPFFIFEEKNRDEAHFYIVHAKGLRHFTVHEMEIAWIKNYIDPYYPTFYHLLASTIIA